MPKISWIYMLAISILYFALNFHWTALGNIVIPSQVVKIVGEASKGETLSTVLLPGAFAAIFANPFFWSS